MRQQKSGDPRVAAFKTVSEKDYFFAGAFNFLLSSIEIAERSNFNLPAIVSITQERSLSFNSKIFPWRPLFVITRSPLFNSDANFFSSFWRFICGRIIKKYATTKINSIGRNCPISPINSVSLNSRLYYLPATGPAGVAPFGLTKALILKSSCPFSVLAVTVIVFVT